MTSSTPLDLRGLNPAPVTPFTRDGAVDYPAIQRLGRPAMNGYLAGALATAVTVPISFLLNRRLVFRGEGGGAGTQRGADRERHVRRGRTRGGTPLALRARAGAA